MENVLNVSTLHMNETFRKDECRNSTVKSIMGAGGGGAVELWWEEEVFLRWFNKSIHSNQNYESFQKTAGENKYLLVMTN